jgi:general stress protein YciG
MTENTNPGNFANRPKEEVQEIARKGGQASHTGGFASMDPDKQVWSSIHLSPPPIPQSLHPKSPRTLLPKVTPTYTAAPTQLHNALAIGLTLTFLVGNVQREIASKGGQASSGSFEKGSERAREAGRKGGLASGGGSSDE